MIAEKVREAYKFLGLNKDSSLSDVTRLYRKLAKKYHPDSNQGNPSYSHTMMMRINEAYRTIKEFLGKGYSFLDLVQEPSRERDYEEYERRWQDQYQRQRAARATKEAQRAAREREVIDKFWERLVNEQKQELIDKKSYDIIIKYCSKIISFFYKKNLHNPIFRMRPYSQADLQEYLEMYTILFEKSAQLAQNAQSERYRRKSLFVHDFLKSFKVEMLREYHIGFEKRASAVGSYENAVRCFDRFMEHYFSAKESPREEVLKRFKESLNSFEYFAKSYPESLLIECTRGKIDLLEKMYRAFIKEV